MIKFLKILCALLLITIVSNAQISTKEVYELLEKYNIQNKDVVMRIAIHETNWFKSNRAVNHNNLFGFVVGKTRFESYDASVLAYKNRVESRLRQGENYYVFLKRIKYAADPKYISKLKRITYSNRL